MSQIYDFFSLLRYPIGWCLRTLAEFFGGVPVLAKIGAFGLAIIATTLIIRALLFPLFGWGLRTTRRVQQDQRVIAPQLQEIRKRYRRDPQKLREEMNKLYAEHGMSPFSSLSGCLPTLAQLPVLFGLYRGINDTIHATASTHFLWISDASKSALSDVGGSWSNLLVHPALLIIPLLAGAGTYMQSRMMMPPVRDNMSDQERSMLSVSRNMTYLFPLIIIFTSLSFPQGLALYWVTGTIFMVAQQYHLVGWGSLNVPSWVPGAHRVTPLSYPKADPPKAARSGSATRASRPAAPSTNGSSNGSAPARPPRAAAAQPAAPGRGRAPARPQKKAKRRR